MRLNVRDKLIVNIMAVESKKMAQLLHLARALTDYLKL